MKPIIIALCARCRTETPFDIELVNPNFEMLKCEGCKKKSLCQTFRIITKGDRRGKT